MKRYTKGLSFVLAGALLGALGCGPTTNPTHQSTAIQPATAADFRTCGTRDMDPAERAAIERYVAQGRAARATLASVDRTIQVYFHVITDSDGYGDVSEFLPAQIAALNTGYSGEQDPDNPVDTGIRFVTAGVDVTANSQWFSDCLTYEEEMKDSLYNASPDWAQDASVLHFYTCIPGGYLGFAYYPSDAAGQFFDGVVVDYGTLIKGAFVYSSKKEPDKVINYSEGDTGTHEVGHWLGLPHTFEGGCSPGDGIDDTTPEGKAAFYCKEKTDTCKGKRDPSRQKDPIHNFMDYTDDDCLWEFTPGQADVANFWAGQRGI